MCNLRPVTLKIQHKTFSGLSQKEVVVQVIQLCEVHSTADIQIVHAVDIVELPASNGRSNF